MRIEVDTHTHTVLSGHAHSTLLENAAAAAKIGLKGFVLTDHGPAMQAAPPEFNVLTYPFLPRHIDGVRVYPGLEANIIDLYGGMDVRNEYLKSVDFVIAALHDVVMRSVGKKADTQASIGALHNPHVDMLAHPDSPSYMLDYEAVVKAAAQNGKLLEVNDQSFSFRPGGITNAVRYLALCKRYGVRVAVSSDAHFAYNLGRHSVALRILEENDFPDELIVNLTMERFEKYLLERQKRLVHKESCKTP